MTQVMTRTGVENLEFKDKGIWRKKLNINLDIERCNVHFKILLYIISLIIIIIIIIIIITIIEFMVRMLLNEYEKWGLKINVDNTFYVGCGAETK